MVREIIVGLIAVGLLIGLVVLRGLSGGRLDVKHSDAIIVVVLVVLWLLISERITTLVVGSEGIAVETARKAVLKVSARRSGLRFRACPSLPSKKQARALWETSTAWWRKDSRC